MVDRLRALRRHLQARRLRSHACPGGSSGFNNSNSSSARSADTEDASTAARSNDQEPPAHVAGEGERVQLVATVGRFERGELE